MLKEIVGLVGEPSQVLFKLELWENVISFIQLSLSDHVCTKDAKRLTCARTASLMVSSYFTLEK